MDTATGAALIEAIQQIDADLAIAQEDLLASQDGKAGRTDLQNRVERSYLQGRVRGLKEARALIREAQDRLGLNPSAR